MEAAMTTEDNAFRAKGDHPHLDYDYVAYPGDKKTWAVRWGFVTTTQDYNASVNGDEGVFPRGPKPMFRWGGSFGGWVYGAAAYAGDPDDNDNVGPAVNDYSNFAGVFGTGVFVNGVAGTSTNNIGVYGQSGDDPNSSIPEGLSAGVVGVISPPGVAGVPSVEGDGRHWVLPARGRRLGHDTPRHRRSRPNGIRRRRVGNLGYGGRREGLFKRLRRRRRVQLARTDDP
jgi:hypothetical protein